MSKKQMWKLMWLKVRYNSKAYVFFIIATAIFLAAFFTTLLHSDSKEVISGQSLFAVSFTYIPILAGQMIQPVEHSKCYYLVPRTEKDRKRFIIFQNICKMVVSFLGITVLFVIAYLIRPEVLQYLLNWYLLGGLSLTFMIGMGGYSMYYHKAQKSYRWYIVSYTITVIIILAILYGGMFFCNSKNVTIWTFIAIGFTILMLIYHIYYLFRFLRIKATYENIDKEERKIFAKSSNYIS